MKPVFSVDEMRYADSKTIEMLDGFGTLLMEHAGTACVNQLIQSFSKELINKNITIICGKGNNGGDGLVIARLLKAMGVNSTVFILDGSLSLDANFQLKIMKNYDVDVVTLTQSNANVLSKYLIDTDIVVDALLGTGLKNAVTGVYKTVIDIVLNNYSGYVLAVDIPSGLSGDKGIVSNSFIKANCTVTFGALKYCHVFYPSYDSCGKIIVDRITIPNSVFDEVNPKLNVVELKDLSFLKNKITPDSHKGTFGHVGILGGIAGKMGASVLAGYSALKSGAGLVTILTDKEGYNSVSSYYPELMYEISDSPKSEKAIVDFVKGKKVIAVGPGYGYGKNTKRAVKYVADNFEGTLVLDADIFHLFSLNELIELNLNERAIITPHPGEMSVLLGINTSKLQVNRYKYIVEIAQKLNMVVVLKGHGTLISNKGIKTYINPTGSSALSTAGSGDVLTGITASIVAQGYSLINSATASVYLHGLAGDLAEKKEGRAYVSATSIISKLKKAFGKVIND